MSLKFSRWLHKRGVSRKRLRGGRLHAWIGDHLFHRDLWQLRKDPVSRAWFMGCLVAFSPLLGAHLIISCLLAIPLRANLPVTFSIQWLTNPFTAPIYYPAAFLLGCKILRLRPETMEGWRQVLNDLIQLNFGNLALDFEQFLVMLGALFVGCLITGLLVGVIGYILIQAFWPAHRIRLLRNKDKGDGSES